MTDRICCDVYISKIQVLSAPILSNTLYKMAGKTRYNSKPSFLCLSAISLLSSTLSVYPLPFEFVLILPYL